VTKPKACLGSSIQVADHRDRTLQPVPVYITRSTSDGRRHTGNGLNGTALNLGGQQT
jgi:hypothetical protein